MPITYATVLIGAIASAGVPGFSGFFSKDMIIEAAHLSKTPGAGSVIIAMHHEQDMRKMGGLRKYMPITYLTVLIGAIANAGLPPFSGFFSKETIVEAAHLSKTPGAELVWILAMAGVFVSAVYSFRLVFYAFHGKERFDAHGHPPHESPWVVTVPLVLLAIPSIFIGGLTAGPMLYGDWFAGSIAGTQTMAALKAEWHGAWAMIMHAFTTLPFYLALGGTLLAAFLYLVRPDLPGRIKSGLGVIPTILERKYGFDEFNDWFFAGGARKVGTGLWMWGDKTVIDGIMVNGSARLVGWFAGVARKLQTGYIYHYAFTMIFGVFAMLTFFWLYLRKL